MIDWKRIWREWLWDWRIAKPYFVVAGVGIYLYVLAIILAAIGVLQCQQSTTP